MATAAEQPAPPHASGSPSGADDPPEAAVQVHVVAAHLAGALVGVVVERLAVVGHLQCSVPALRRAQAGGRRRPRRRSARRGDHGRPRRGALVVAGALPARVALEDVDRLVVVVEEHLPELRVAEDPVVPLAGFPPPWRHRPSPSRRLPSPWRHRPSPSRRLPLPSRRLPQSPRSSFRRRRRTPAARASSAIGLSRVGEIASCARSSQPPLTWGLRIAPGCRSRCRRARCARRGPRRSRARSPGRAPRRRPSALRSPRTNGSKTRSRSRAGIPSARVGDLDLDPLARRLGADSDAAVRGVWRIAFWIRLNSTRCSFSGSARAGAAAGSTVSTATATPFASASSCIAATRLVDQLADLDSLDRPMQVTGLEPRELEQVVDHRAERGHVGAHAREVAGARLARRRGRPRSPRPSPEGGHRRAQVVGDRGDEVPARGRRPRRAGAPARRAGRSSSWPRRRARRARQRPRRPHADRARPLPTARSASRTLADLLGHAGRGDLRGPQRHEPGGERDRRDHQRVVVGHEHQLRGGRAPSPGSSRPQAPPPARSAGEAVRCEGARASRCAEGETERRRSRATSTPVTSPGCAP